MGRHEMRALIAAASDEEKQLFIECNQDVGLALCFCNSEFSDVPRGEQFAVAIAPRGRRPIGENELRHLCGIGVRYLVLQSTGYDHIAPEALHKNGIRLANGRAYSPNAIADLAFMMGVALLRGLPQVNVNCAAGNFRRDFPLAREVRDCTVGILGTGAIGFTNARYYTALGATVLGWDKYPRQDAEGVLTYVDLDELLSQCDIVSVHLPYIPGQTDNVISVQELALMKQDAILVNAARGELVDFPAVLDAVESNRLGGYGCDVFPNEEGIIGRQLTGDEDSRISRAMRLYPKVLITPHIGAWTQRARRNMVLIALQNAKEFLTTDQCTSEVS